MEFQDDAFVLSARPHGESGAIVDMLTAEHGKYVAHVAGGASRRIKPTLQPGARIRLSYRARVAEQLGSASIEPLGEGPASLFDDPLALAGLSAAAAVAAGGLPERVPHAGAFNAFGVLLTALLDSRIWPAVFVRWEAGLLEDLGFGLDLSCCAATGTTDDLVFLSPRTGRAVSLGAGAPYKDRLLALPPFLLGAQAAVRPGDVGDGLTLTGHFLARFVFAALNRPLPAARFWLVDRLTDANRL